MIMDRQYSTPGVTFVVMLLLCSSLVFAQGVEINTGQIKSISELKRELAEKQKERDELIKAIDNVATIVLGLDEERSRFEMHAVQLSQMLLDFRAIKDGCESDWQEFHEKAANMKPRLRDARLASLKECEKDVEEGREMVSGTAVLIAEIKKNVNELEITYQAETADNKRRKRKLGILKSRISFLESYIREELGVNISNIAPTGVDNRQGAIRPDTASTNTRNSTWNKLAQ